MPSLLNVVVCALTAIAFWTALGLPLARRLAPARVLALPMAPILGWAVFGPPAFLVFLAVGFTRASIIAAGMAALAASAILARRSRHLSPVEDAAGPTIPWWGYGLAALVAIAPAIAILPKYVGDGVILAVPIFDHSKVAIVDDLARLGVPAGNPFFGAAGTAAHLPYYYLWHLTAATFAVLLGTSGWEADAGLTWSTAFASLMLMIGLGVWLSRRQSAALLVPLLGIAGSLRPLLRLIFGGHRFDEVVSPYSGLQTWVVQGTWSPQHLAAATTVIVAVILMAQLARGAGGLLAVAALGAVVTAGFESSTWVGGVTFAIAAIPIGCVFLAMADPRRRFQQMLRYAIAALIAVGLAIPFLRDEYAATLARHAGLPIAVQPFEMLTAPAAAIWNILAFWGLLLIMEFPAIFPVGVLTLGGFLRSRPPRLEVVGLALLAAASLLICGFLASTIANNDLGWRGVLPGVMVLTMAAGAGLATWSTRNLRLAIPGVMLLAAGLPDGIGFIRGNISGWPSPEAAAFAATPELWQAVRRYAHPADRVGSNPESFANETVWPINISWALLADRRSCYAGWELVRPLVALPNADVDALEARFTRIFAGDASAGDTAALAHDYDCRVIVVVPSDGAWQNDPFAKSPDYRLAQAVPEKWRIYVRGD